MRVADQEKSRCLPLKNIPASHACLFETANALKTLTAKLADYLELMAGLSLNASGQDIKEFVEVIASFRKLHEQNVQKLLSRSA